MDRAAQPANPRRKKPRRRPPRRNPRKRRRSQLRAAPHPAAGRKKAPRKKVERKRAGKKARPRRKSSPEDFKRPREIAAFLVLRATHFQFLFHCSAVSGARC